MSNNFNQRPGAYLTPRQKDFFNSIYEFLVKNNVRTVLDVGGATGDFSWYAPEGLRITTLDKSKELVEIAKKTRLKNGSQFITGDILDHDKTYGQYDAVTIFGAISTFDDLKDLIKKLSLHTRKHLIIHNCFNPYPYDVLIKHREFNSSLDTQEDFESGFNLYSLEYMYSILNELKFKVISEELYRMTDFIPKTNSSSLRNYNCIMDGEVMTTNQLGVCFNEYIIIASKI